MMSRGICDAVNKLWNFTFSTLQWLSQDFKRVGDIVLEPLDLLEIQLTINC